ncbi:MAG TPA: substrate-binding domain-containing protein [Microbacteriaceae bacterium]|jgi:molybdate transport system substrate-binding protein|nr:substrate-binding domain-containing protein [Microbacteriaceae bacterium]
MPASSDPTAVSLWAALVVAGAFDATVIPAFTAETEWTVDAAFDPTTVLMKRIADGELPEVIISTTGSLEGLPAGTLAEASITPLVRTGIGVGAAEGSAARQIETVEDLTAALLAARSVAYSRTGQSGIYFASLIEKLGIADEVNAKATIVEKGFTGEAVIDGRADLAIQQVSELRYVPGIAVVGPLPEPVQWYTDFSIAITSAGADSAGAQALHAFLLGELARNAYVAEGLQLPTVK